MKSKEELGVIIDKLVQKNFSPSTIGHILRDEYKLKVKKLTRVFPQLNQKKSEAAALNLKIKYMALHLQNNKKDYVTSRRLESLKSKAFHLNNGKS